MKENKQKYYNEINSLRCSDPKKMWSEIKKQASNKARSNPFNCDISPDRFNRYFINITENLDVKFKVKPEIAFLWKSSRNEFKFQHISHTDIQYYFNSLADKNENDILYMDVKLLKLASRSGHIKVAWIHGQFLSWERYCTRWLEKGQGNTGLKEHHLYVTFHGTTRSQKCISYSGAHVWNFILTKMDPHCSIGLFKSTFRKLLMQCSVSDLKF